jgi:hypothetical protein
VFGGYVKDRIILDVEWKKCLGADGLVLDNLEDLLSYIHYVIQSNADFNGALLHVSEVRRVASLSV